MVRPDSHHSYKMVLRAGIDNLKLGQILTDSEFEEEYTATQTSLYLLKILKDNVERDRIDNDDQINMMKSELLYLINERNMRNMRNLYDRKQVRSEVAA